MNDPHNWPPEEIKRVGYRVVDTTQRARIV
jgi:hypothetical protein